jgi:hypothetical protein
MDASDSRLRTSLHVSGHDDAILIERICARRHRLLETLLGKHIRNWGHESVPAPGHRLNVERVISGVTEGQPYLLNGGVQTVIEFDVGIGRPNTLPHCFSANRFSRTFEEQRQHLKGLVLQANSTAVLGKNALLQVSLKRAEADQPLPRRSGRILPRVPVQGEL